MRLRAAAVALLPAVLVAGAVAQTPNAVPEPPRHLPIAPSQWQPRTGDVILRASADLVGRRIRAASGGGAVYSHVGLVVERAGGPAVIDVSPFGGGTVEFSDVGAFTTAGETTDLLILRPRGSFDPAGLEREAERLARTAVPFDYDLDLQDPAELYCAELVRNLLAEAGLEVGGLERRDIFLPFTGLRTVVVPDAFARTAALGPIFRRQARVR